MLRTIILFWLIAMFGSPNHAQNLVPNPGFERCDNCNARGAVELSVGGAGANNPADWRAATHGTSDIRSEDPRTGNRHGGLFAGTKYEYLANELTNPLTPLSLYQVEFYIKAASNSYFVDEIGFHIQTENPEYFIFTSLDFIEPVFKTPEKEFVDDSDYVKYEFDYLACGGEAYILLGRFQELEEGDTLYNGSKPRPGQITAYYLFDDVSVTKRSDFEPFPEDSLRLCGDTTLLAEVAVDTAKFSINLNGSSTSLPIQIIAAGTYILEITCKSSGHSVKDTLHVYEDTLTFSLPSDTAICSGEALAISGPDIMGVSYTWSTGDTTRHIEINEPQTLILTLSNGCVESRDTMNVLQKMEFLDEENLLPNAFTPNGDDLNDVLRIDRSALDGVEVVSSKISIYNRWGQQVFYSENPDFEWQAEEEISEVYLCVLLMTITTCQEEIQTISITKDVTLIK